MTTDQTRDPIAVLTAARPSDDHLAEAWTEHRADAALAALLERTAAPTTPATNAEAIRLAPRRTRRRVLALGVAAAVTAVAALAGTAVLAPDSTLPKAAAVERLATIAATAPTPVIAPGQYLHRVVDFTQEGRDRNTPQLDGTNESWTDATGFSWRRDVSRIPARGTSYSAYAPPAILLADPFNGVRPADYAKWPTDQAQLTAFLRSHFHDVPGKTGDASQSIFEDLSDKYAQGMVPSELSAALIRVVGTLPEVHVSDVEFAGHQAVELEYRGIYVNAMYFDRRTAAYLGETSPGSWTAVRLSEVVDEVPAVVRENAHADPPSTDTQESVDGTR